MYTYNMKFNTAKKITVTTYVPSRDTKPDQCVCHFTKYAFITISGLYQHKTMTVKGYSTTRAVLLKMNESPILDPSAF